MKAVVPIKMLKLEDGFHLLIAVRVNGKPARMLIDTGASKTVFDKERSRVFLKEAPLEEHDKLSTGLGTSSMKSHLAVFDSIALGAITTKRYKSVVIDLSHVNKAYGELKQRPIDGVLGSDLLRKYNAVIDYSKRKLFLKTK